MPNRCGLQLPNSIKDINWKKAVVIIICIMLIFGTAIFLLVYFLLSGVKDYQEEGLKLHNCYRETHGAGRLQFSDDLNSIAKDCAGFFANEGRVDIPCPYFNEEDYGMSVDITRESTLASDKEEVIHTIKRWYDESSSYDFGTHLSKTGSEVYHFSQMVWKSSKELGIGLARGSKWTVVVCIYKPKGNKDGWQNANVFPSTLGKTGRELRQLVM